MVPRCGFALGDPCCGLLAQTASRRSDRPARVRCLLPLCYAGGFRSSTISIRETPRRNAETTSGVINCQGLTSCASGPACAAPCSSWCPISHSAAALNVLAISRPSHRRAFGPPQSEPAGDERRGMAWAPLAGPARPRPAAPLMATSTGNDFVQPVLLGQGHRKLVLAPWPLCIACLVLLRRSRPDHHQKTRQSPCAARCSGLRTQSDQHPRLSLRGLRTVVSRYGLLAGLWILRQCAAVAPCWSSPASLLAFHFQKSGAGGSDPCWA